MAATAADVPDDFKKWWETFNNGVAVDQGQDEEEDGTDSDSGFEQGQQQQEGEENAGVVAGEETASDAHAPAGREGGSGSGAARDCEEEGRNRESAAKPSTPRGSEDEEEGKAEDVSEDNHVQIGGGLQGMKRKTTNKRNEPQATGNEIQNEEDEHVSEDNYVKIGGWEQGRKREVTAKRNELQATGIEIQNEEGQDNYIQIGGWEQGRKRKAAATPNGVQPIGIEIQNKTSQGEYLRAEIQNEEDQEGYVSDDKIGGGQQGRKRKTTVAPSKQKMTGIKIRKKNAYGECLRVQNQMLSLQLVRKTKELEAEQIRRLELELHFMRKENQFLNKQLEELKAENEYYKKTAKPTKTRRLCRFCKEYVDHDFRNCPERRASACSEEDDGSI